MTYRTRASWFALIALYPVLGSLGLAGCVLAPSGTRTEQERMTEQARHYEPPLDSRELPPLPSPAGWQDALHRAFLANGDLEAAYFEWKAAMTRIDQSATWPNSNLAVSYGFMFSNEKMKTWNRNSFGFGFDPAMSLQLPIKPETAGKVAFQEARAAGFRFLKTKFDVQQRVLNAFYDLALVEERIRIQQDNVRLLEQVSQSARVRVQAGAPQQDLLKAQIEYRMAQNELGNMEAEARGMRAMLNGMLSLPPDVLVAIPPTLPAPRPELADDARLIAMGVAQNPELAALAAQVAGRQDALELARLRYIPDINPQFSFTGSVSQTVGAMVMLPTMVPAIQGAINESAAMLRSAEAMSRQTGRDRVASFVAALYFMRNAERQVKLFEQDILPLAQQTMNSSRQAYAAGTVAYADLIDSQRTLLNVRLMIAQVRIEREKRLAELETLAGTDIEALTTAPPAASASPPTSPTTQPASSATTAPAAMSAGNEDTP